MNSRVVAIGVALVFLAAAAGLPQLLHHHADQSLFGGPSNCQVCHLISGLSLALLVGAGLLLRGDGSLRPVIATRSQPLNQLPDHAPAAPRAPPAC